MPKAHDTATPLINGSYEGFISYCNRLKAEVYQGNAQRGFYDEAPVGAAARVASRAYFLRRLNLMQTEIGELYDSLRVEQVQARPLPKKLPSLTFAELYKEFTKGTAEEELADIAIRIIDFFGAIDTAIPYQHHRCLRSDNASDSKRSGEATEELVMAATKYVCMAGERHALTVALFQCCTQPAPAYVSLSKALHTTLRLAQLFGINLKKAIAAKLKYNATRAYKHGKNF
jgi:hypothetical protein